MSEQPVSITTRPGSVQSSQRAFTPLETMADHVGTLRSAQRSDTFGLPRARSRGGRP